MPSEVISFDINTANADFKNKSSKLAGRNSFSEAENNNPKKGFFESLISEHEKISDESDETVENKTSGSQLNLNNEDVQFFEFLNKNNSSNSFNSLLSNSVLTLFNQNQVNSEEFSGEINLNFSNESSEVNILNSKSVNNSGFLSFNNLKEKFKNFLEDIKQSLNKNSDEIKNIVQEFFSSEEFKNLPDEIREEVKQELKNFINQLFPESFKNLDLNNSDIEKISDKINSIIDKLFKSEKIDDDSEFKNLKTDDDNEDNKIETEELSENLNNIISAGVFNTSENQDLISQTEIKDNETDILNNSQKKNLQLQAQNQKIHSDSSKLNPNNPEENSEIQAQSNNNSEVNSNENSSSSKFREILENRNNEHNGNNNPSNSDQSEQNEQGFNDNDFFSFRSSNNNSRNRNSRNNNTSRNISNENSRTQEYRNNYNRTENSRNDFQSFFEGVLNNRRTFSTASSAPLNLRGNLNLNQAETLRDGVVNVVRFIRADGLQKANIIIDPPALGRISVELTSGTSGVEASIKVASEQIRQLVQDQISQLRMNLSQQGVQVAEFSVDVQQDNSGQQQNSQQENNKYFWNNRTFVETETEEEEFRIDLEQGLLYWVA